MRARELVLSLKQRSVAYRHNHLLVPFGDDFKFKNAEAQFRNMDKLIGQHTSIHNNNNSK